jgi:hypothetical protein
VPHPVFGGVRSGGGVGEMGKKYVSLKHNDKEMFAGLCLSCIYTVDGSIVLIKIKGLVMDEIFIFNGGAVHIRVDEKGDYDG